MIKIIDDAGYKFLNFGLDKALPPRKHPVTDVPLCPHGRTCVKLYMGCRPKFTNVNFIMLLDYAMIT